MSRYFLDSTAFVKLFVQEAGTDTMIRLMEAAEDNSKLISAITPLDVYAALLRRERAGDISPQDAQSARDILRLEAARMVQQPLNPAVLEAARQLLDHYDLRSQEALQLASIIVAREMAQGLEITLLTTNARLLQAARQEHFPAINPIETQPCPNPAIQPQDSKKPRSTQLHCVPFGAWFARRFDARLYSRASASRTKPTCDGISRPSPGTGSPSSQRSRTTVLPPQW